jgi:F-type H+-transporting ATPase subunit b
LQSIAMMIFVWVCMKFLWPPLIKAMDERRERIAEGLAASDRAEKALEAAKQQVDQQIREARDRAGEIVDQAAQRQSQIIDQARDEANAERRRQVSAAEADIAQATNQAREELRTAVASLAVLGASKILEREVDANTHRDLLDKLIAEI